MIKHEQIGSMPRMFLDGLGLGAALFDAHSGRILYANNSLCRVLQYEADELLKTNTFFIELIHPQDRDLQFFHRRELLNGVVDRCRFEARYLKKDGTPVRLRATQTAIRNPDTGTFDWMTSVLDEVSETTTVAEEKPLIAAGLDAVTIWNWTLEDRSTGASARYDVLLGQPRTVHQPSIEILLEGVHPDDAKTAQLLLRRSLSGVSGTQDYRQLDGKGEVRWVREMVVPVKNASGAVTNVIGTSVDITGSKNRGITRESESIQAFIQHLQTHWEKPLTISAVARQHKVSVRRLQKYFSSLGITPLDFLKRIRLVHAYDMLVDPKQRTTVTKVCTSCGFGNLGHFARDYRNEFGELPSETLLRSRARSRAPEAQMADTS
jgi:PAS domain S-box-containing protein